MIKMQIKSHAHIPCTLFTNAFDSLRAITHIHSLTHTHARAHAPTMHTMYAHTHAYTFHVRTHSHTYHVRTRIRIPCTYARTRIHIPCTHTRTYIQCTFSVNEFDSLRAITPLSLTYHTPHINASHTHTCILISEFTLWFGAGCAMMIPPSGSPGTYVRTVL